MPELIRARASSHREDPPRGLPWWLAAALLAGCGGAPPAAADLGGPPDLGPSNPLVAARPYRHQVPSGLDPARPAPLLILLHGFSADGFLEDAVFGLSQIVDDTGFLYAFPDGSHGATGMLFWNATDACCDFSGSGVDDVAYLDAVIDDMSAHYRVDPARVYVVGHSNGAFMAYRYACDRSERIAAFLALAGTSWSDPARCPHRRPVALLHLHGDADQTIFPAGGNLGDEFGLGAAADYPPMRESVTGWARANGCAATADTGAPPLDLLSLIPGDETTVERWTGCPAGGAVELWSIGGGSHAPSFRTGFAARVWDWLAAHPRP